MDQTTLAGEWNSGEELPVLDEAAVEVHDSPLRLFREKRPFRFVASGGKISGVSDHLPVSGRILFPKE